MKKFNLLLLDANVVIYLFKLHIWNDFIKRCDVQLARSVIKEARFYEDDDGEQQHFDLNEYVKSSEVNAFEISLSELDGFLSRFDATYFDKLDPGETESLAHLLLSQQTCRICSADAIVFRVLGNLKQSHAGISLEETLSEIGLGRRLPWQFTKAFREKWTTTGFQEGMQGVGLKA